MYKRVMDFVAADNDVGCPPALRHAAKQAALSVTTGLDLECTTLNAITILGTITLTITRRDAASS